MIQRGIPVAKSWKRIVPRSAGRMLGRRRRCGSPRPAGPLHLDEQRVRGRWRDPPQGVGIAVVEGRQAAADGKIDAGDIGPATNGLSHKFTTPIAPRDVSIRG
jgi:hypothetical protein